MLFSKQRIFVRSLESLKVNVSKPHIVLYIIIIKIEHRAQHYSMNLATSVFKSECRSLYRESQEGMSQSPKW
jgi:hypothetical protein